MSATNVLDDPVMFLPEVEKAVRLSATTIWRKEGQGTFPPRSHQGRYAIWFTSQIAGYLESLRARPNGPGPAPAKANEARRQAAAQRRRDAPVTKPRAPLSRSRERKARKS
jgi:predicted DNA-binding transcriptional regulator AlpA